ncbi:DUF6326 family protein [Pontibacter sp. G13]|uniref:DUF6326 family protein n=1 Tax=Pontibacter sp. G13 TaxID=3074898 RepID=UPI00288A06E2|nr:DUF6326 family protein [Pontibacter sp. G13]WNJ19478.1 DUF6326 family protein [Pontibacter sp. G13]
MNYPMQIPPRKTWLSLLWIFVMFNYLYCDIAGLMDPQLLNQYLSGSVEGISMTPEFLLLAGILMEIPIAMIVLSRILPDRSNAWFNLVASFISTAAMVGSLLVGIPAIYYAFFAVIEITTTVYIFTISLRWLSEKRVVASVG